jgi:hypothetical protein
MVLNRIKKSGVLLLAHLTAMQQSRNRFHPGAEFLNILKCNSAESASTGSQFNFMIFLMIKL